jgi:hypothetical protein
MAGVPIRGVLHSRFVTRYSVSYIIRNLIGELSEAGATAIEWIQLLLIARA